MNTSRLRHTLLSFVTSQAATQAIQIVSGFLLVRYMDVHDYGIVAFMLAVQGSAAILSDMGLKNGIVAVIGQQTYDKYRLGSLVGAAMQQYRMNSLPVSAGIVAVFIGFHFLQGLPLVTALVLSAVCITSTALNAWSIYYSTPWVLSHDVKTYYKPQIMFQALRLALLIALLVFNYLDVITLACANALAVVCTGLWYKSNSTALLEIPDKPSPEDVRQLHKYILPLMPLSIFSAFQDQVTVLILAVAGQTTNLAQAFALNRLTIVFQFFGAATILLAAPWVARAADRKLPERFTIVAGGALALASAVVLGSILFPDLYLWILGGQYQGLYVELKLAMAGASAMFLYSVLYALNNVRRWTWPWSGASYVIAVIAVQVACVTSLDMSQTRNALLMSMLVGIAMMLLQILHTMLGFAFKTDRHNDAR